MKKLSLILIGLFLCYIVYYDVQFGTLPAVTMTKTTEAADTEVVNSPPEIRHFEFTVKQGETVLSIIERTHGKLPASIETIVKDFEKLNKNAKAEAILPGKTYLFPDYRED